MNDPCPSVPHCPTCPKLRASQRHLGFWEHRVDSLRLTLEALGDTPAYGRAREKHAQELQHAEQVVKTLRAEGFWDGRLHNQETVAG